MVHAKIVAVTRRMEEASKPGREAYLARIDHATKKGPRRGHLSCGNMAHAFAGCSAADKDLLKGEERPSLGIVSAYNDMLSAHKPYENYPEIIRAAAREQGAGAQVAGGVPAMCDGVTQGQPGMELSLFSRDVIAMSAAIALAHDTFDAALYLGICDKIVPGLLIGALSFGHIPGIFIPAGPMPTGQSNEDKTKVRQLYAEGKVGKEALLDSELASYHSPGTCTFYGTANSNQFLMEIMGLHLPGAAFVQPGTPLREALTRAAAKRALEIGALGTDFRPIGQVIDAKSIVNAVIGLHATGGSTNHTMHLIAIAAAAGITLTWQDFSELSEVTPLLCRVYPNGPTDVNGYHEAGGTGFTIGALLRAGLMWDDARSVYGASIADYAAEVSLGSDGKPEWRAAPLESRKPTVVRTADEPFRPDGGLKMLGGNLGSSVIKISSVADERLITEAPARVFHSQEALQEALDAGEITDDVVAVVRFQGPSANGMPELHSLTPGLTVLQSRGARVALVTDGRMSGASGRVPAAIHVTPEAAKGGPIAKVRDGDMIRLDAVRGKLEILVDEAEWAAREPVRINDAEMSEAGSGRELFAGMRALALPADQGGGAPLIR